MKTYEKAPDEVHDRVAALIARFYPEFKTVRLKLDLIMASTDAEDGHAVALNGYPCQAVVKIIGLKERTMGRGDAEIVIDAENYDSLTDAEKDALLDHELYHLDPQRNKSGKWKTDDQGRIVLKMRKHDRQFGWFDAIARRHGKASAEVIQFTEFTGEAEQLYLGLDFNMGEVERLIPRGCDSVSITTGTGEDKTGVKIDADGVHPIGKAADPIEESVIDDAVKIIVEKGKAAPSVLQRAMRIGYVRAELIMQELEKRGIVGPERGMHGREILKTAA